MRKKPSNTKKLQQLLERSLDEGVGLSFFLPHKDVRNPTWDEVRSYATEAYAMALEDVFEAMEGNWEPLTEAVEGARLFVAHNDEEIFMETLDEFARNPPDSSFDDEDDDELEK